MSDKYYLFVFEDYYPEGGWGDFSGIFNSEEEAVQRIYNDYGPGDNRAQIVHKNEIIRKFKGIYNYDFTEEKIKVNGKWEEIIWVK